MNHDYNDTKIIKVYCQSRVGCHDLLHTVYI